MTPSPNSPVGIVHEGVRVPLVYPIKLTMPLIEGKDRVDKAVLSTGATGTTSVYVASNTGVAALLYNATVKLLLTGILLISASIMA